MHTDHKDVLSSRIRIFTAWIAPSIIYVVITLFSGFEFYPLARILGGPVYKDILEHLGYIIFVVLLLAIPVLIGAHLLCERPITLPKVRKIIGYTIIQSMLLLFVPLILLSTLLIASCGITGYCL